MSIIIEVDKTKNKLLASATPANKKMNTKFLTDIYKVTFYDLVAVSEDLMPDFYNGNMGEEVKRISFSIRQK